LLTNLNLISYIKLCPKLQHQLAYSHLEVTGSEYDIYFPSKRLRADLCNEQSARTANAMHAKLCQRSMHSQSAPFGIDNGPLWQGFGCA
jgi:hypothetical protein